MNRPDIAAFVLLFNAAWMLTAAAFMSLIIWRGWASIDAKSLRDGLLTIGCGFGVWAIIVKVAL